MRHPSTVDRFLLLGFPLLVGFAVAIAPCAALAAPANNAVYAFAQQKIYGMTLTASGNATLVGDAVRGLSLKMTTAATSDNFPGAFAVNGGLDVKQSFISNGSVPKPMENFVKNTPYSAPSNEIVLRQAIATALGTQRGFATDDLAPHFTSGQNFSRSDAYVTPAPDARTFEGSASPPTGAGWPTSGTPIAAGKLFAPIGSRGTLSIDSVAEALLTTADHDSIGSGLSDWVVTGRFKIVGRKDAVAAVKLDFNVAERLVVHSHEPIKNISTASNSLAFDVLDGFGRSVFGSGFLGNNPSATRLLSSPATGSETYNFNTVNSTNLFPGPSRVDFQTEFLPVGDYTFTIKGTTTAYVSAVPEITSHALLATAGVCAAAFSIGRRRSRRRTC